MIVTKRQPRPEEVRLAKSRFRVDVVVVGSVVVEEIDVEVDLDRNPVEKYRIGDIFS